MKTFRIALALAGALFAVTAAQAQTDYTLDGDATLVSPGNASLHAVRLTSASGASEPFGAIEFAVPDATTVSGLDTLATDYMAVAGDCGGGSPRFQVRVDMNGDGQDTSADANIFVYIGPTPNFTDCPTGWQTTPNLISDADLRVDTTQVGGTFYDTWANAETLVGANTVLSVSLVVDSSWSPDAGDPQTFDFDNVDVDGVVFTFEPLVAANKQACKKNGWRNLARADGSRFKNQGDCIQYVNTGK